MRHTEYLSSSSLFVPTFTQGEFPNEAHRIFVIIIICAHFHTDLMKAYFFPLSFLLVFFYLSFTLKENRSKPPCTKCSLATFTDVVVKVLNSTAYTVFYVA